MKKDNQIRVEITNGVERSNAAFKQFIKKKGRRPTRKDKDFTKWQPYAKNPARKNGA